MVLLEARRRRGIWLSSRAAVVAAVAGALAGCGLIAPFSLADLPALSADGDADGDGDSEADGDALPDGDAPQDGDAPAWDPLAGCTGGETEEQWLVAVQDGGSVRSVLTGRDCADPRPLCEGCVATALSPSGERAVANAPSGDHGQVHDDLLVFDLTESGFPLIDGGFEGAQPAWLDDDTLLYLAAPGSWAGSCHDDPPPPRPEVVDLRRRTVPGGEDALVATGLERGWVSCCSVVSADGGRLALAVDRATDCDEHALEVTVVELSSGERSRISWTVETRRSTRELPLGLLPGGQGMLFQRVISDVQHESKVYASTLDGEATSVTDTIETDVDIRVVGDVAPGIWGGCVAPRRVGPACELYCRDWSDRRWYRHRLGSEGREPVPCTALGADYRIMDVRQVPAGG